MDYKKYLTDIDNLNITLDDLGIGQLSHILTENESINYRNKIWDEIKHVTQNRFDIEDESTWSEFYNLQPMHSMILHHYSLGHMQPIWDLRTNPKIYQVFEQIWGVKVDDLLTSFDGLSIHLPPEKTGIGWQNENNWFHTDQSSQKIGKHCIQGMINLYPVNKLDATLSILERSHIYHKSFFEDNQIINYSDWYQLKTSETYSEKDYFLNKGCIETSIKADIGSMTLWDSRTFHQGIGPSKSREINNIRMVIYISMMPRSSITNPKLLIKRQKAFTNLKICSHWANTLFQFPTIPKNELGTFNKINLPIISDIGKRLIGFN
jgi:hypothetical protein